MNNIKNQSITLSTGKIYTPKKGKPPVCPCLKCKDKNLSKFGACNKGFGVCADYMDYEHMKAIFNRAVF